MSHGLFKGRNREIGKFQTFRSPVNCRINVMEPGYSKDNVVFYWSHDEVFDRIRQLSHKSKVTHIM